LGMTKSPFTIVLETEPIEPSSWCQAASTRAVTLLLGTMGLPAESRGSAMKSGKFESETGG
jgi:hypothetical protein